MFSLHDNGVEFSQVISLNDSLELMLKPRHGPKAVKTWIIRLVYSQPLKQIEKIGFQC